ncbi:MAG: hypothetical protein JXQ82_10315 [Methanomicrobiaceae archaeon]|nr:hypothetical protein [Methanomicrobiaceae archaeon]
MIREIIIVAGWNYTKKATKAGFLYGLTGLLYFSVIFTVGIILSSGSGVWLSQSVLIFLILGVALFLPSFSLFILLMPFLAPSDTGLLFCTLPFGGAIIGAALGLSVDLTGKKKEKDNDSEKTENDVFTRIPWGKNRHIVVTDKILNYCILAEIIILVLLFIFSRLGSV